MSPELLTPRKKNLLHLQLDLTCYSAVWSAGYKVVGFGLFALEAMHCTCMGISRGYLIKIIKLGL